MPTKASFVRLAALALIVSGAGVTISNTAAFTQVDAGRGVAIDTAADRDALLGLVDQSSGSSISDSKDTATVYEITDNTGASLTSGDIDVTVSKLTDQSGADITNPPVQATVSGSGSPFPVDIECTSETDSLGGSYDVGLDFVAATGGISITATRTTDSSVDIDCTYDYGATSNYRDDDGGGAAQPTDPSGDIENPSAVNENDDNTATALSPGSNEDLKVGYALPTVDDTADTYRMFFDITNIKAGNGNFGFYLVNGDGQQLTSRQVLEEGQKNYNFTDTEEQDIAANADDLYLIIDSQTSGRGDRELEIDYFRLNATSN